jgi:hypothetical protein
MKHPLHTAKQIADILRLDPIAAGFVHEFIKPEELLDLLNLRTAMSADIAEAVANAEYDMRSEIESLQSRVRDLNAEVSDLNRKLSPR